jgi:anhydro-N-acetylmuramic acid kinase
VLQEARQWIPGLNLNQNMIYRAIGLMSGSSLDGLDIAFSSFQENAGKWDYEIIHAECYSYPEEWVQRLKNATQLPALDYELLHADYGRYSGEQVNKFIETHQLHYQVALIASHGHTTFHLPQKKMTAQLGNGAAIAAATGLPVVTDLRALDVALGGQGAPIVPIGEKLLLGGYDLFLNLGGIANLSFNHPEKYIAFDICPANRVLNILANKLGKEYDESGTIASTGTLNTELLNRLNELDYYKQSYPKSLANDFGTELVYPIIRDSGCETRDALRTYIEHIVVQITKAITRLTGLPGGNGFRLLATGGGAFNGFLVKRLKEELQIHNIEVIVPEPQLVNFKEALIMGFIGVIRWRQEYNVLSSVTGASRDSIGGALWTGQEA